MTFKTQRQRRFSLTATLSRYFVAFLVASRAITPGTGYAQVQAPKPTILSQPQSPHVLFQQPQNPLIADRFIVPPATHIPPSTGKFQLVLWQPNPNSIGGGLVPTSWDAGSKTGFYPPSPVASKQLAFQDQAGSTTAQMDGDTVGVYLNSRDLPDASHKNKFMITPVFLFERGKEPKPFPTPATSLNASMDLQVPTATDAHRPGSETYIVQEFVFRDRTGLLISYGIVLFFNGYPHSKVSLGHDDDTNSLMVNSPLGEDERFVSKSNIGMSKHSAPWRGWRHFEFSINQSHFASALKTLFERFPKQVKSLDPADYVLTGIHLNAELHFGSGPAELGWSMRKCTLAEGPVIH